MIAPIKYKTKEKRTEKAKTALDMYTKLREHTNPDTEGCHPEMDEWDLCKYADNICNICPHEEYIRAEDLDTEDTFAWECTNCHNLIYVGKELEKELEGGES